MLSANLQNWKHWFSDHSISTCFVFSWYYISSSTSEVESICLYSLSLIINQFIIDHYYVAPFTGAGSTETLLDKECAVTSRAGSGITAESSRSSRSKASKNEHFVKQSNTDLTSTTEATPADSTFSAAPSVVHDPKLPPWVPTWVGESSLHDTCGQRAT